MTTNKNNLQIIIWVYSIFPIVPPTTNVCYNVTHQQCKDLLHYNYTFMAPSHQTTLDTVFSSVIASQCSNDLQKFLCFTQFPPCNANVTAIPCQSLCDKIDKNCWKEFKKANISIPDCDFIFPDEDGNNSLCEVTKWPAPWPKEFRPAPPRKYWQNITFEKCHTTYREVTNNK